MHFERQHAFKMHKIVFFPEKKMPTHLKFSDLLPGTHFFIWPNSISRNKYVNMRWCFQNELIYCGKQCGSGSVGFSRSLLILSKVVSSIDSFF